MFGVLVSVCFVPMAATIIVTDPPPTTTEHNYSYNILDPRTGDAKSLYERRRGDVVTGSYSVIDPDGTHRLVEYTADSRRGFEAVVRTEPLAVPFQHAVREPHYFARGNIHYLSQYHSPHTLYRERPLPEPLVVKASSNHNRQPSNNIAEKRQSRYFTPSNEIKPPPAMSFKGGEHFAPANN